MDSLASTAANITAANGITANVTTANIKDANITAIFFNFHMTEKFDHHLPNQWFSPYVKDIKEKLSTKHLKAAFMQSLGSSFDSNQLEHNLTNTNHENDNKTSSSGLAFSEIGCRNQPIKLREGGTVVRHGLYSNLFYGFANVPVHFLAFVDLLKDMTWFVRFQQGLKHLPKQ